MYQETAKGLTDFLEKSPTAFHVVAEAEKRLREAGYRKLSEQDEWILETNGKYYVTRNQSSILAFAIGSELRNYRFKITASHSDSPAFKIKENAELQVKDRYTQLNTEGYGGMLCATWLDRPLSVAGRVIVREEDRFVPRLFNIDRDLLLIPNVAIHMNREVNNGYAYNKQVDMLPLLGSGLAKGTFRHLIAAELGVEETDIYGTDLYLYNRMKPTIWGAENEYLSAPRLDDLMCAYASLCGFLEGTDPEAVNVYACFDNEEVGSVTRQGAGSTFLADVLYRINLGLGRKEEDYYRAVSGSFMLSCDNAHAVHPNHPEQTDKENCVYMNQGVVIKSHAGQKYTSDGLSVAIFKGICEKAGVPVQFFANRSDMNGGSTLGNIATTQVSVNAVDIGLAQLAMHSSYETAGVKDGYDLMRAIRTFYMTKLPAVSAKDAQGLR